MKLNYFLIFSISLLVSSCTNQTSRPYQIGLFDVSKDDRQVLFSLYDSTGVSIYSVDSTGRGLKAIIPSSKDSVFFNPKFDENGEKILFIGKAKDGTEMCNIYISAPDGTQRRLITTSGQTLISEAVFSECEDKIYYIKSSDVVTSSPLARKQPHGSDVYSVDIKSKKVEKITELYAYALYRVSELDCNSILMHDSMRKLGNMVMFSKLNPDSLFALTPVNNPRKDISLYSAPVYSKQYGLLAFSAPYELYIMNLQDKIARPIVRLSDKMINSYAFLKTQRKLIFNYEDELEFNIIDLDDNTRKTIKVSLDGPY